MDKTITFSDASFVSEWLRHAQLCCYPWGAVQNFKTCVTDLINFSTLDEEIEKAKPDGRVDEVFKKIEYISVFIAEKGPECLKEKSGMINDCLNNTFSVTPSFDKIPDEIPEIKFGEKECNQLTKVQSCVVSALETCAVPTSANIVESLFKFARKSLPCKEIPDDEDVEGTHANQSAETTEKPNSGSRVGVASLAIIAAIVANMFV
ncbi:27 kDa hemolymph protein [Papilio machaon]|uniref:27 kDa hemolymph protein n=1 Tax=Papilio machaon TaxID=76193 RepID=A0A0N1PHB3_PAPMA|nr:27 kDa hemolymph protein [Papilio machaon]